MADSRTAVTALSIVRRAVDFRSALREPRAYADNAILTPEEVAAWLGISLRKFERLDMPCIYLGSRTRRYLAKDVIRWLEKARISI